jgi:hypothetical protein
MLKRSGSIWFWLLVKTALFGGLFALAAAAGSLCFFEFAPPEQTCLSCHEIRRPYDLWAQSAHREISCKRCHGGTLTSGLHGVRENLNRLVAHFRDVHHDQMGLSEAQVVEMTNQCKRCHAREFVQWRDGGHGITYRDIFLNTVHNHTEQVAEECLRCHGMFFAGPVGEVVQPLNTKGPWQLKDASLATRPVIPCLACHQVHVAGHPISATAAHAEAKAEQADRHGSIALYSRRERAYFAAADLPLSPIYDHGRAVLVSPDPRQRLCVECHAPNAFRELGSSDDRMPIGVHEGLSCGACHSPHSNDARASCTQCHPKFSHCGLDVATMDTTARSRDSRHDIHRVHCTDCHPGGAPKGKASGQPKSGGPVARP